MFKHLLLSFLLICSILTAAPKVTVGIDVLLTSEEFLTTLKNKKVGLITNQTAVNKQLLTTRELLKKNASKHGYTLSALFAPEHGINGASHASESIKDDKDAFGTPIFSLHGKTRRPTPEMLKHVDVLVYDIQDIGSRSYTYITTLFYAMEEAAKHNIPVIVLDRPNPINGTVIDGPMLEEKWKSMVGYINVPYCHGMTVGELAQLFNEENKIGCNLTIVPMKGWNRKMSFVDTGLPWIPTSPHIPEPSTTFYYPITGLLGELQIVNIGVGYTLPFKVVGAPWINAQTFSKQLNAKKLSGVQFLPFYYKPFYGRFAGEECQGVQIIITDSLKYKPVSTQYLLISVLNSLYPEKMKEAYSASKTHREMFCKVNGTDEIYNRIVAMNSLDKLTEVHKKEKEEFLNTRKKYLIGAYDGEERILIKKEQKELSN